jgi:hypothetical protein
MLPREKSSKLKKSVIVKNAIQSYFKLPPDSTDLTPIRKHMSFLLGQIRYSFLPYMEI